MEEEEQAKTATVEGQIQREENQTQEVEAAVGAELRHLAARAAPA